MSPTYAHWCHKHQCAFVFARFTRGRGVDKPAPVYRCPVCVDEAFAKVITLFALPSAGPSGAHSCKQIVLPAVFHPDGIWPV